MPKLRHTAFAAAAVGLTLSIGCASRPLKFGGAAADEGVVRTGGEEAAVVTLDERPTKQRRGLFDGRVFGGRNDAKIAEDVGIVQTGAADKAAAPVQTAAATQADGPRQNFSQIFDMIPRRGGQVPASTARLEDPFLSSASGPEAGAFTTPKPQKPAGGTSRFGDDFDRQLAALEQSRTKADPVADELEAALAAVREAQQTPAFEPQPEPPATPAEPPTPSAAPSGNPFEDLAAAEPEPAADNGNPFADLMSDGPAPTATPVEEPRIEEPGFAAAKSSEPPASQSVVLEPSVDETPDAPAEPDLKSFAVERVGRLMDMAEMALKSGQLDRASETIDAAIDAADMADLEFGPGDRDPYALQRRIEAVRDAAAMAAEEPTADAFQQPQIIAADDAEPTPAEPEAEAAPDNPFQMTGLAAPLPAPSGGTTDFTSSMPSLAAPTGLAAAPPAEPAPAPPADEPGFATIEEPPANDAAEPDLSLKRYDESLFSTFDAAVAEVAPETPASRPGELEVAPPPPMMLDSAPAAVAEQGPLWPLLLTVALGFVAVFTFRGKPEAAA